MLRTTSLAIGLTAVLMCGVALADEVPDVDALKAKGADALLKKLDERHNHYPTQKWEFKMVIKPASGPQRSVTFNVMQKGEKRLVRFTGPGDVKGMSVLSKGDTMYVYSPQTDNVRRVATSARRQTLLGSDFSYDDMAQIDLAPRYDAKITKEEGDHIFMDLTKKADADVTWDRLKLRIDKNHVMIDRIQYVEDGKVVKEQLRDDFAVLDGAPTYKSITVRDPGTGHASTLLMLSQKIGEDIPNKVFSKRTLVRGR